MTRLVSGLMEHPVVRTMERPEKQLTVALFATRESPATPVLRKYGVFRTNFSRLIIPNPGGPSSMLVLSDKLSIFGPTADTAGVADTREL